MAGLIPGETLRMLLVSVEENVRDEVTEALTGRIGEYRLYWISQPDLAPLRAQDLIPHVVLLDNALGNADVAGLIRQLQTRAPGAAILMLVPADAMEMAQQAVLAGARGFVVKPLQAEDLEASLRQLLGRPAAVAAYSEIGTEIQPGRSVVFCAPKGGTGRTTLAINTAISLHQVTGQPVALVDADYAAPAIDVALNLPGQRTVLDLLPRLARLDPDLIMGVMMPHVSGVQVLLAPPPADLSNPISLPQVQQILALLKRMFPWVVVDLGLPMDETAFAFLDGADRIVMSVLPEMVGLRNTRLMMDLLHERGYPDERVWLVLNRASMKGGIPVSDIEERLRVSVQQRIPDDQALATHSVNRGVPLTMSHGRSSLARSFKSFSQSLIEDVAREDPTWQGVQTQSGSSFLDRLFRRSKAVESQS
ncbi:MAG: response regulator [Chloroflexota bacterium]|nr:response regulator [Chloroflexota bacterium]